MQEIPRVFVKHGGALISQSVTLIIGNGESYLVDYCPRSHFLKGFRNLIQQYSLKENDVMMFSYVYESEFVVHLFRASEMQLNYNSGPGESSNIVNSRHDEDVIFISDSSAESEF